MADKKKETKIDMVWGKPLEPQECAERKGVPYKHPPAGCCYLHPGTADCRWHRVTLADAERRAKLPKPKKQSEPFRPWFPTFPWDRL
jgi:hypothetical protein